MSEQKGLVKNRGGSSKKKPAPLKNTSLPRPTMPKTVRKGRGEKENQEKRKRRGKKKERVRPPEQPGTRTDERQAVT